MQKDSCIKNLYSRLLKNTHLLRCARPSSLQRTVQYASFLVISCALHLNVFDQPVKKHIFNNLIGKRSFTNTGKTP
jgi:hypothetical protein